MATEYEIIPSTEEHALELATNMRIEDVREIWAAAHLTPNRALLASLKRSFQADTCVKDGKVIAMRGIVPLSILSPIGIIWMLSSTEIVKHRPMVLKESREWIKKVRQEYSLLTNFVDARNTVAKKWLSWLGFYIYDAEIFGADKLPFHRFEMRS